MDARRATIVVVEPAPLLRKVLQKILAQGGYHVLTAKDGHEALDLAAEHFNAIDLVITSVELTDMTGPNLARRLAGNFPNVGVLLLSSHPRRVMALDKGWRYLQKPYFPSEVLDTVREMLKSGPERAIGFA